MTNNTTSIPDWVKVVENLSSTNYYLTICLCSVILFGNGLTIVTLYRYFTPLSTNNRIIFSLAISDFMTGAVFTFVMTDDRFFGIAQQYNLPGLATLKSQLTDLPVISSMMHVLLIAVDRFVAITTPLRYNQVITPTRITKGLAAAWVIPLVSTSSFYVWLILDTVEDANYTMPLIYRVVFNFTCYFLVCILIVMIYVHILAVAIRQRRQITQQNLSTDTQKKNNKTTRHIFVFLLISYIVSWTPFICIETISSLLDAGPYIASILALLNLYSLFVGLTNSAINCLVYVIWNKQLRRGYYKTICCNRDTT